MIYKIAVVNNTDGSIELTISEGSEHDTTDYSYSADGQIFNCRNRYRDKNNKMVGKRYLLDVLKYQLKGGGRLPFSALDIRF